MSESPYWPAGMWPAGMWPEGLWPIPASYTFWPTGMWPTGMWPTGMWPQFVGDNAVVANFGQFDSIASLTSYGTTHFDVRSDSYFDETLLAPLNAVDVVANLTGFEAAGSISSTGGTVVTVSADTGLFGAQGSLSWELVASVSASTGLFTAQAETTSAPPIVFDVVAELPGFTANGTLVTSNPSTIVADLPGFQATATAASFEPTSVDVLANTAAFSALGALAVDGENTVTIAANTGQFSAAGTLTFALPQFTTEVVASFGGLEASVDGDFAQRQHNADVVASFGAFQASGDLTAPFSFDAIAVFGSSFSASASLHYQPGEAVANVVAQCIEFVAGTRDTATNLRKTTVSASRRSLVFKSARF